jgi:lactate 2-monooxygenase
MTSNTSIVTAAQHYTPDPEAYVQFQREIYASLRKPKYSTKPHEWEAAARNAIPLPNFLYVFGSASSESTYAANRSAFQRYRLRPSMLVQATRRDMSTQLFGKTYKSPILIAPIGVQEIVHPDAEEATARAAHAAQVPMILSTAATRSIEQVAKANADGDRWYQLYWPKPQAVEFTASLLNRAKDNGFSVLVVTLDTFQIGWRPNVPAFHLGSGVPGRLLGSSVPALVGEGASARYALYRAEVGGAVAGPETAGESVRSGEGAEPC